MLLLESGDIFFADIPQNNTNGISGQRPVIVLKNIGNDEIKVVPLSSNMRNDYKRTTLKLQLGDKHVSVLCDYIMTIHKSLIKNKMGQVSSVVLEQIEQMVSMTSSSDAEKTESKIQTNDITIYESSMNDLKDYIIDSHTILNDMTSKKAMVINIIIAISTGIIASLITNVIWLYATNFFG